MYCCFYEEIGWLGLSLFVLVLVLVFFLFILEFININMIQFIQYIIDQVWEDCVSLFFKSVLVDICNVVVEVIVGLNDGILCVVNCQGVGQWEVN